MSKKKKPTVDDIILESDISEESTTEEYFEDCEDDDTVFEGKKSIFDVLEEEIVSSDIPEKEKVKKLSHLLRLRSRKVNILVTGATGVGKSSTINALFNMEIAKVGVGVDPETSVIQCYQLDNLTIWDTPGLGDNVETDKQIKKEIVEKLSEAAEGEESLIDLVIVVLDASSKDLGTCYELINNVLIPCLGDDAEKRILIALNQSDIAMKGNHWDKEKNEPDDQLKEYLEKKTVSVAKRIKEATGLKTKPIYFCAGYMEEGDNAEKRRPYNLTKLLYYIIKAVPKDKRLVFADNLNEDEENWKYDDQEEDYNSLTSECFWESVGNSISEMTEKCAVQGGVILGIPGMIVGAGVGAVVGVVRGVVGTLAGNQY